MLDKIKFKFLHHCAYKEAVDGGAELTTTLREEAVIKNDSQVPRMFILCGLEGCLSGTSQLLQTC